VLKAAVGWIAIGVLPAVLMMMSCAPAQKPAQRSVSPASASVQPAADTAPGANTGDTTGHLHSSSNSGGLFQTTLSPIGFDYAPETRCSDNNPNWHRGHRPVACNPPPGETCGDTLSTCPARCQQCYSDDLSFIQRELKVNAITIYRPNYYILKAAQRLGMKVVVGLLDDAVLGLAAPASQTECTDGGTPLYLCGANYASAVIDGACIDTVGTDPFKKCVSHCAVRSDPKRDCVNGDCSCNSDADCEGPANRCLSGSYMAPLNNSASGQFLRDGTVVGIQIGNEFFEACQIPEVPGKHQPCCSYSKKTGRCTAWTVNREVMSTAAQTMRTALDHRGLNNIKISVALVEEQGPNFCQNGAPPPGVDYIADHPYCDFVANLPPLWTTQSGSECWEQARNKEFVVDQKACGATRTYIGETGFNTGCPLTANQGDMLKGEADFVAAMVKAEPACNGERNPTPFPDFLFEFGDVCPPQGCLAGCGDPQRCDPTCCCQHRCSDEVRCDQGCPACVGNGYFGLFNTPGYGTAGFPPEPKLDPMPSLMCPAAAQ
jgi:hypothetical protein